MIPFVVAEKLVGKNPEEWKKRVKLALGATALAGVVTVGGCSGFVKAMNDVAPVKQETSVAVGEQKVTSVDLNLSKQCNTGYTTTIASLAKVSTKVMGIEAAWKSREVTAELDTKLCMDSGEVKAELDKEQRTITVRLNPNDITSDVVLNPASLHQKPDMSATQIIVENAMNIFRGTPFVEDIGFIKDTVAMDDGVDSFLASAALTKGMKATADQCTPQVFEVTHTAFEKGIAKQILTGARLYDPTLAPENVKVLIGEARTPADNSKQGIGRSSNIDKADASLQAILDKNKDSLSANQGTIGKCELSDEVRQMAAAGVK